MKTQKSTPRFSKIVLFKKIIIAKKNWSIYIKSIEFWYCSLFPYKELDSGTKKRII